MQNELNRLARTIDSQLKSAFHGNEDHASLQEDTGKIKEKWLKDEEIDIDDLDKVDAYGSSLSACTIDFTQKDIDKLKDKVRAAKPTKSIKGVIINEPEFDMKLRSKIISAHLKYATDNSPNVLQKPAKHFFNSPKKQAKVTAPPPQLNDNQRFEIRGNLYANGITQRWEKLILEVIELVSSTKNIKLQDGQSLSSSVLTSEIREFYDKVRIGNITPQDVDDMKSLLAFMKSAVKQEKFANNQVMDAKLYRFSEDMEKVKRIVTKENKAVKQNTPTQNNDKKQQYFSFNLHIKQNAKKVASALKKVKQKNESKRKKP